MRYVLVLSAAATMAMVGGCNVAGLLAEPTLYEKTVPAEFDIAKEAQGTIAVLVQGGPSDDIRRGFADTIALQLVEKARVKKKMLVPASEIDKLRQNQDKFLAMMPAEVGAAVGAGTVLVVKIGNYELYPLPLGGYYDGSISASAMLVDVRTGTVLWPEGSMARQVSVAVEAERGDADAATGKLLLTASHGIVRYLYNCPKAYFRIPGESRGSEWDNY